MRSICLVVIALLMVLPLGCERDPGVPQGHLSADAESPLQAEPVIAPASPSYDYHPTEVGVIDESGIELVLHVDPAGTSSPSEADGSADRPFATVGDASGALRDALGRGIATKLLIAPGVYRENLRNLLNFPEDAATIRETLLVVEGASRDSVILSGSVTEIKGHDFAPANWRPVPGHAGLYEHDWPFEGHLESGPWMDSYGFALLPGVMQRTEMIWVDGKRPRQVLAERYRWEDPDGKRTILDYGPGTTDPNEKNEPGRLVFDGLSLDDPSDLTEPMTFAVYTDPASPDALRGKVFLRLGDGQTMADVGRIEIGWWKGRPWTPMLIVKNKENFVLRNLTIRHGAMGPMAWALNIQHCVNFLIEDLNVSDNTAGGLLVGNSHHGVVRRVRANDNGAGGMGGSNATHVLFEDCETSFNNYRGAWAGWVGWHASAFKSGGVKNITVRRHTSIGNYANGIWYDVYCRDVLVEDSLFLGNCRMGVMFELTRPRGGPHTLRNSVVAFNHNTGVYLSMAANSHVLDNFVAYNGGGGTNVEGESKHTQMLFKFRDHPQGPNSAEDWQYVGIAGNTFINAAAEGHLVDYLERKSDPPTQFPRVLKVLDADANDYRTVDAAAAFRGPDGRWIDLSGWRALLADHHAPGGRENASNLTELSRVASDSELRERALEQIAEQARVSNVPWSHAQIERYLHATDAGYYAPPHLLFERQDD